MIKNLKCCDTKEPLAAEAPFRFTFEVEDFSPKFMSAEIALNGNTVWQSGIVEFELPYVLCKAELSRRTCYTFAVTLTDEKGNEELVKTVFETGLFGDFEGAAFIGSSYCDTAPVIYKNADIKSTVNARLYLLSLGFAEVYINGEKVSDALYSPSSDYHKRPFMKLAYPLQDEFSYSQYYTSYDVSDLLQVGENHLAVLLGNGWYNQTFRRDEGNVEYGEPRFKLLLVTDEDKVISDEQWDALESPIVYNQLFIGEIYDGRMSLSDALFGCGDKSAVLVYQDEDAVLRSALFPPDRVIRTIKPELALDDGVKKIYDMGENSSGRVVITTSVKNGEKITLQYAETVKDGALYFPTSGRGQNQTDVYVSNGEKSQSYAPQFTWHGFRFFSVEGQIDMVECEIIHSDLQPSGYFRTSNVIINGIVDMYLNAQWSNTHLGVPSDCPHRERLGYTGDGQLTADTACFFADMRGFYRKWMRDIADGQCKKTGHVQHTAPFAGGGGGPSGWGGAIVIMPWSYYLHYGETDILEEYIDNMLRFVGYMESRSEEHLIVREEEGGWCLGEWCTPDKVELDPAFVNTCLYIDLLSIVIEIAKILGKEELVPELSKSIEQKRAAVKKKYYLNQNFDCGKQGAEVFAFKAGLLSSQEVKEKLLRYKTDALDTGIFGTPLLIDTLFEVGLEEVAISLLTRTEYPSFGYMLSEGATTLWEYFCGGSNNHPMFGAFVGVLIRRLLSIPYNSSTAGLKLDKLLSKTVGGLEVTRAAIHTPFGLKKV